MKQISFNAAGYESPCIQALLVSGSAPLCESTGNVVELPELPETDYGEF